MKTLTITFTVTTALIVAYASPIHAQEYPSHPISMVVPYPPGGSSDSIARILASSMSKTLKQPIVVDNVSGAGGTVGAAKVARAQNDGYTLLLQNIGMSTAPFLYRSLSYKNDDFTPIGAVATVPEIIVTRKDLPVKNLSELLAYIKKDPAKVNLGHSGVGSAAHLCALQYQAAIKQRVTSIAYKGGAPAMNDIMGGQFDFMCEQTSLVLPYILGGKVNAIAVTSKNRLPLLPSVPTTAEGGLPSVDIGVWHGVYAPKGVPQAVIDKLSAAVADALRDPDVKRRFAEFSAEIAAPEEAKPGPLRQLQLADDAKWGPILKAAAEFAD